MANPRRALLKQLRTLGYQVTLREDARFFDIYQDQGEQAGQAGSDAPHTLTLHRLSYPEAKQLAAQPAHPVTLYLFPEPATQGELL